MSCRPAAQPSVRSMSIAPRSSSTAFPLTALTSARAQSASKSRSWPRNSTRAPRSRSSDTGSGRSQRDDTTRRRLSGNERAAMPSSLMSDALVSRCASSTTTSNSPGNRRTASPSNSRKVPPSDSPPVGTIAPRRSSVSTPAAARARRTAPAKTAASLYRSETATKHAVASARAANHCSISTDLPEPAGATSSATPPDGTASRRASNCGRRTPGGRCGRGAGDAAARVLEDSIDSTQALPNSRRPNA